MPGGYRFSYDRHLGDVHLVVIDSRNGRVLDPGSRSMVDDDEWAFVEAAARQPCRHLVLATSLPMFVPGGLHGLQQWNEAVCDGRWGRRMAASARSSGVRSTWRIGPRSTGRFVPWRR